MGTGGSRVGWTEVWDTSVDLTFPTKTQNKIEEIIKSAGIEIPDQSASELAKALNMALMLKHDLLTNDYMEHIRKNSSLIIFRGTGLQGEQFNQIRGRKASPDQD